MNSTIIVIEDNFEICENIESILELAQYDVITASNGKIGLQKIKEKMPDLIICDVMMPELDGYELLHILSKDPETLCIPFIFLTAKAEKSDIRMGMNMGADDYIVKPFEALELLKVVEMRLKKNELIKTAFKNDSTDIAKFFDNARQLKGFENLSEDHKTRTYKKKEMIFMEGHRPNDLYFIIKGEIKTLKSNQDGKELITGIHYKGDFIGYIPLLKDTSYTESAVAMDDLILGIIGKQDFLSLLYTNREVASKFITLLSNNLYETEKRLLDLAYQSVRQRVAGTLLSIHEQALIAKNKSIITVSRKDIASIVGTATESLNRTLADFKDEGLIELREEGINIVNKSKLERLSV